MQLGKKLRGFTLQQIPLIAIIFVVIGIVMGAGAMVLGQFQADMTADSLEYNITQKAMESLETFANNLPLLAIIIVVVIIVGLLFYYLLRNMSKSA